MTHPDKLLYLEMQKALSECQFLRTCEMAANERTMVYCELVTGIAQYLPANRCMFMIEREHFSVGLVRELYEQIVCVWLQEAYDKAEDLARVPMKGKE